MEKSHNPSIVQSFNRPILRIGIFGGTFNPIHIGHLRSAEEVGETQGLDRILFVPSATPPHKQADGLVSAAHRLAMVRLAIAGNPRFRVSTIEIERAGRSFSVDTLCALRAHQPRAHFAFILGIDAFREIATWKDYRRIFALCDVIVTSRPPLRVAGLRAATLRAAMLRAALPVAVRSEFCYRPASRTLEHRTGNQILFQRLSDLDISASTLRDRLRHGLSIRYLVPTSVHRYIARHELYGPQVGSH
jgi:nicotinate-nucleotide adenylyltransferase